MQSSQIHFGEMICTSSFTSSSIVIVSLKCPNSIIGASCGKRGFGLELVLSSHGGEGAVRAIYGSDGGTTVQPRFGLKGRPQTIRVNNGPEYR